MDGLIQRQTSLSGNIIMFCRFLRSRGFTITSSEEEDVMNAIALVLPFSEARYVSILKAILCKNKFQFGHFEDLYRDFQFQLEKAVDGKIKNISNANQKPLRSNLPSIEELKSWLYNKPTSEEVAVATFSNIEVLAKKDFSNMTQDEVDFILRLLQKLSTKILRQKSRSKTISKNKRRPDLALTLRKNLRSGIEIKELVFSKPKDKKLKLVLLCDVSRSMDLYSRFFVQMIYAFQKSYDRIETFVFSTALHQVTEILGSHSFNQAFDIISDRVPQWSGGTKIGACLDEFCKNHAYGLLDRKTVVMILSDGWDTGDPITMTENMKRIYKSSRKVLWLNPLAGNPDFKPEVVGLKNIMPYIDKLYAAHNLESLKRVLNIL